MFWYNERQALIVAEDLLDGDAAMADAMDVRAYSWSELGADTQKRYLEQARSLLSAQTPLDLSRPLKMRDGVLVTNARLSDDGIMIYVDIPAWRSTASWSIDGRSSEDGEDPMELIYADSESDKVAFGCVSDPQ